MPRAIRRREAQKREKIDRIMENQAKLEALAKALAERAGAKPQAGESEMILEVDAKMRREFGGEVS